MTAGSYAPRFPREPWRLRLDAWTAIRVGGLIGACLSSLALLGLMGLWALVLPVYLAVAAVCVWRPGMAAALLLVVAVALEPGAVDWTDTISRIAWLGPPGFDNMPAGPLEILLVAVALSLWFRRTAHGAPPLPAVAWLLPPLLLVGFLHGLSDGAQINTAYHEARGLIFATIAFVCFRLMTPTDRSMAAKAAIVATVFMAVTLITRYLFIVAPDKTDVPVEKAFTHEGPIILAIAAVAAVATFVREKTVERRFALFLYCLLLGAAIFVTGRRSATLALLVGGAAMAWYLIPRRPGLVGGLSVLLLVVGAAYMTTFWSAEYGALAQPARAVRSQFDPSPRDLSSDQYRKIEITNVVATIEDDPLLGVGFGNPFREEEKLPDLTSFWPLQLHQAHQSVLWLWLKMGVVGVVAFLSLWVIAVSRCALAIRNTPGVPVAGITAAAGLFMVFGFANVDTVLAQTRGAVMFAIVVGMALALPSPGKEPS